MGRQIDVSVRLLIADLHELAAVVEQHLGAASTSAREEWCRVCDRIPRNADVDAGILDVEPGELEGMKTRITRFSELLRNPRTPLRGDTVPALDEGDKR